MNVETAALPPAVRARAVRQHPTPCPRHELRKLFHGPVLGDIAEQVWVRQEDGTSRRYGREVWKEWFRQRFLRGRSTEDLTDERFHLFILAVQAEAASEMGVTFHERVRMQ